MLQIGGMKKLLLTLALLISAVSFGQTAEEYFNRGNDKAEANDHYGAISDFNKAIELNPNLALAYNNRGLSKDNLKDYNGAISDYTKAIEINPNYAKAYNNRSVSKELLGDLTGACADAKKAINLGSNSSVKWMASNCN